MLENGLERGPMSLTKTSYAFQAVFQPNIYTVVCDEVAPSSHGRLDGFEHAECKEPAAIL